MHSVTLRGRAVEEDLEELHRQALIGLCLMGVVVSWVWATTAGVIYGHPIDVWPQAVPMPMMMASLAALLFSGVPVRWRGIIFILGVTSTSLLHTILYGISPIWLCYQSLVVGIAAVLTGPRFHLSLTALLSVGAVLLSRRDPALRVISDLLPGLGLLWATALTSWLATHNLHTALGWALNSQERAWQTAEEVRARRGDLRRMLDSLRVTHGLLERTTGELDAARREAEAARQVKSRFAANISHELRTPLNVIVGFAEMLCTLPESYGDLAWPPALREDLLTIWRNAEHLLQMVDDVLDLAQIEAARLPVVPEPTDLLQLVRDTMATAVGLLRDSRLELVATLPESLPLLSLDRGRIRQVLLNLINNSVRSTPKGRIEVGAYPSGHEVVVYVRDTGQGIPADKLETIFLEFEQADTSMRRPHQGVGLGLAICRHFVRLHGGRIWAESELGKGSVFCFALPVTDQVFAPRLAELTRTPARDSQQPKEVGTVVALCRDPLATRMLARHLATLRVLPADSVQQAATLIVEQHPRAALIAADTLGGFGAAMADAMSLLGAVAPFDVPIVACDLPTERRAGLALGVGEFLIKPVVKMQLIGAIRRLCASPRRVLVVDDEPDMVRLLSRMIRQEWRQIEVLAATSGEQAMALLRPQPDLILLDLRMPGMDGVALLEAIHANSQTAAIPIIVITARGPAEDLAAARNDQFTVLRNRGFAAGELVCVVEALAASLPPHYVVKLSGGPDTPGVQQAE